MSIEKTERRVEVVLRRRPLRLRVGRAAEWQA